MTLVNTFKKNKLLVTVFGFYMILFLINSEKALTAFGNSLYYLKEMMLVLPVIFLLTVALEVLVPKEVIIKHFGENSGFKGNILSLLLGSISAGPIYAAFPICKMLLSKGARVSNIVIILSSWAVIKVPMLANEARFLGVNFMGIRWVLTVLVILVMARIINSLVSISDINTAASEDINTLGSYENIDNMKIGFVNSQLCIGCGICTRLLPELYVMKGSKAIFNNVGLNNVGLNNEFYEAVKAISIKCPVKAIIS